MPFKIGRVEVPKTYKCPECYGDGECYTSHRWTCPLCKGLGVLSQQEFDEYETSRLAREKREQLLSNVRDKLWKLSNTQLQEIINASTSDL